MEKIILHPEFITATIMGWKRLLKPDKYKHCILEKLKQLVQENKIILYAYCIMENHMHLIWQIKGEHNPSDIRQEFFQSTAKHFKEELICSSS